MVTLVLLEGYIHSNPCTARGVYTVTLVLLERYIHGNPCTARAVYTQ